MDRTELTELKDSIMSIFEITDIKDLGNALYDTVMSNDIGKYERYCKEIGNLNSDSLQPIFQYYMADRKEKCQDFTPESLGLLVSGLIANTPVIGETTGEIYDMCAGCGSLSIQQWNRNKNSRFICRELDERAIPFLLFNLAVRNIEGIVYRGDVLKCEDYEKYVLHSGQKNHKFSYVVKEEV